MHLRTIAHCFTAIIKIGNISTCIYVFLSYRPKDAIKAVKKRLSQNMGKNHTAVMYTLTVSQ